MLNEILSLSKTTEEDSKNPIEGLHGVIANYDCDL